MKKQMRELILNMSEYALKNDCEFMLRKTAFNFVRVTLEERNFKLDFKLNFNTEMSIVYDSESDNYDLMTFKEFIKFQENFLLKKIGA